MKDTYLIKNGTVVSVDPSIGIKTNCDVLVEDGIIKAVEPNISVAANAKVIDATDAIISPGFIDTHRHTWQTQLRTVVSDYVLADYMANIRRTYGSCYTPRDTYLGNYCGCLESIDAGITFLLDHAHIMNSPAHADSAIKGILDAKVRGVFCYCLYENPIHKGLLDGVATPTSIPDWRYADCKRIKEQFFPQNSKIDLLRFGLAPTEVDFTPLPQCIEEIKFGRSIGAAIITGHIGMGKYSGPKHLVRELEAEGLLASDLCLSHGATLFDDELEAVKRAGVSLSTTPDTELQMDIGMPIAFKASRRGCIASLGIDLTSNNAADMFQQMRLLLQAQRYVDSEAEVKLLEKVSARCEDVLRMATMGGAEAMGLADVVGSVTPGKRADLLVTQCDNLRLVPAPDPVKALVLYANASDIDIVMVDGVVLKQGGKLVGVDLPTLRKELRESTEAIMERSKLIPK